jgi:N-acetylmuramoyl-L-alanine amidase
MTLKLKEIYSPNFDSKRRKSNQIRFLIFHYTGMKSEKSAIQRLSKIQSEVGTNYFIKKNGEVIIMVPDLYIAWHAGVSQWGKYKFLNKNSIGIEISNPGHQFGYVNFSKKQIKSLIKLAKKLTKKYKIKKHCILGHSDIAPDRKKDPGEKFPWKFLYRNSIGIWHNLNSKKLVNFRTKTLSIKETSLFMKQLRKFGYPYKSIIAKKKMEYEKLLVKAFQRRFRPELINGNIDQECLLIINNLTRNKN